MCYSETICWRVYSLPWCTLALATKVASYTSEVHTSRIFSTFLPSTFTSFLETRVLSRVSSPVCSSFAFNSSDSLSKLRTFLVRAFTKCLAFLTVMPICCSCLHPSSPWYQLSLLICSFPHHVWKHKGYIHIFHHVCSHLLNHISFSFLYAFFHSVLCLCILKDIHIFVQSVSFGNLPWTYKIQTSEKYTLHCLCYAFLSEFLFYHMVRTKQGTQGFK